ncbi:hypothetical protein CIB48_g4439 [Xylaria polymorpha]|nr:hypothetical protein CIB48_g4439 [Xylaria polymorpha]
MLSTVASASEKDQVIDAVRNASTSYSFSTLVRHGIPRDELCQAFESNKRFFAKEKREEVHVNKVLGRSFRGWEPPLIQQHKEDLLPDTKETFILGREVSADDPEARTFMTGPNLWPDLPKEEFEDLCPKNGIAHSMLLTVSQLTRRFQCVFCIAAHTDFSTITILLQQPRTRGLQVWYPPTEDWIPVPVVDDGLVINIGDLMEKFTGG